VSDSEVEDSDKNSQKKRRRRLKAQKSEIANNAMAAVLCFAIAFIMLFQHLFWFPAGIYSWFWPKAPGRILSYDIAETSPGYVETVLNRKHNRNKIYYGLTIRYEYEVEGVKYTSDRIWMEPVTVWESKSSVPSSTYIFNRPGMEVKIAYCPFYPAFSTLITGPTLSIYLIVGLIFIGMGLFGLKNSRRPSRTNMAREAE